MSLLLDTHALFWILLEPEKLSPSAAQAIGDSSNEVYVSAVNTWELSIKAGAGRVELPFADLEAAARATDFEELPVTIAHTLRVRDLPDHHRDPFDRLLVAQALAEGLTLVTADPSCAPIPSISCGTSCIFDALPRSARKRSPVRSRRCC